MQDSEKRIELILKRVLSILNEEGVSPEEGYLIAEEIVASSLQVMANLSDISLDLAADRLANSGQSKSYNSSFIGSDRGWFPNFKGLTENN
jgi:hypothetical protein